MALALILGGDDETVAHAEQLLASALNAYQARMRAFDLCCEERGLDPLAIRKAFGVAESAAMSIVLDAGREVSEGAPSAEEVEKQAELIRGLW